MSDAVNFFPAIFSIQLYYYSKFEKYTKVPSVAARHENEIEQTVNCVRTPNRPSNDDHFDEPNSAGFDADQLGCPPVLSQKN